jgi:hypothetical protein
MTFAALAARILVEQWQGVVSADHDLFAFNRAAKSSRRSARQRRRRGRRTGSTSDT